MNIPAVDLFGNGSGGKAPAAFERSGKRIIQLVKGKGKEDKKGQQPGGVRWNQGAEKGSCLQGKGEHQTGNQGNDASGKKRNRYPVCTIGNSGSEGIHRKCCR